jgi:micrococcal nuclease
MRRSYSPRRYRAVIPLALLLLWIGVRLWTTRDAPGPPAPLPEQAYRVLRVVDGDTLVLDDSPRTRVRLIGVNAPESVKPESPVEPFGPEASKFTRDFVAGGNVRLQFDKERLDQYDRMLAYVWVEDKLLNEELLRAGLARWEPHYHYSQSMKDRFRRAQQTAKREGLGVWSPSAIPVARP